MIRTATIARSGRIAALAAVLTGLVLTLSGCGGGQSGSQAWIGVDDGYHEIAGINGDRMVYVSPNGNSGRCTGAQAIVDDIKNDSVNVNNTRRSDIYRVLGSGQVTQDQTTVLWDDEDPGSIAMQPDTITLGYVFGAGTDSVTLVPVDSERGKAVLAEMCDNR